MRRTRIERAAASRWLIGLGVSCAMAFGSAQASAEPTEGRAQARSHFDQGITLARRHGYAEALAEFERAYEISPHFSVLYNIGQALVALGRPTEAIAALDRYIEEGGSDIEPRRRAQVDAAIQSELAKTGSIEVTVDVPGALVTVDDKPYGRSPLPVPVRVDNGAHRVLAVRDSGERRELKVDASGGQITRALLEFGAATPSSPVPPLAREPLPSSVPAPLAPPRPANEPRATVAHTSSQKTLAYVVGAAGVALTAVAAAHFLWNRARYEDWQSRYDTYYHDPTPQHRDSANSLARSISNASPVTLGLAIGAGVALGTSTVLLLTSSDSVTATGSGRGGGPFLTLRGRF